MHKFYTIFAQKLHKFYTFLTQKLRKFCYTVVSKACLLLLLRYCNCPSVCLLCCNLAIGYLFSRYYNCLSCKCRTLTVECCCCCCYGLTVCCCRCCVYSHRRRRRQRQSEAWVHTSHRRPSDICSNMPSPDAAAREASRQRQRRRAATKKRMRICLCRRKQVCPQTQLGELTALPQTP